MNPKFIGIGLFAAVASMSLAACGGGGSSPGAATPPQSAPQSASKATGTLKFTLPKRTNSATKNSGKKPAYISPSFTHATLWIDATAPPFTASCALDLPCTISFSTTAGTHVLSVEIDDGGGASGSILAEGATPPISFTPGINAPTTVTLNGVAFSASLSNPAPASGAGTFGVFDADANPILSPGLFDNGPITLTASDPGVTITTNPPTLTSPDGVGTDYAFTYSGACTVGLAFTIAFNATGTSPSILVALTDPLGLTYGPLVPPLLGTSGPIPCSSSGSVVIPRLI
jgi:hypothetical protein